MSTSTMSHVQVEVAGQPDDWAGVVARLPELAGLLPRHGARVAVVGCGTSFSMAQAYATLSEAAGQGETDGEVPAGLPEQVATTGARFDPRHPVAQA